ncbi:Chemotaxis protein MotA [Desulfatibacillum aliphaticivorans]|uniref:Chemotaxis protein MotA n=1 Tax=Desulfatibacillum aliphaticivorans TaxID=218208 RepID=B8FK42_DESAL|nr:MotA/TolQ/ExbB proton channel family protein [Desulfatibacillum aliphaticivorans]ACL02717.1 Chemotaxis protein MotA [Desulfatibacillum aliphaticivorans]
MDIATILGVVGSFVLVVLAIGPSGLGAFINVPSLIIVVGGTMGATMINYPLKEILGIVGVAMKTVFAKEASAKDTIAKFMDFAQKARREGILSLEGDIKELEDEFMKKGIQLAIDGLEPNAIREIMETEINYTMNRHKLGADLFTTIGTFAPALGMVGTLIGLVQMLQSMEDPSSIGPAMAVALLTTFYGAILANIICMPVAGKLKMRSSQEMEVRELVVEGVLSLSSGENPRIVEQKLACFLPPKQRELAED